MVKISNQRLKRLLPVLCAVLLLTALPLCALADSDAPFSSYVIFGGADFAQLRLDSEHPY